ncbi:MAG: flavodoxin family protein [Candidatus Freyarchaeota archaeon]
MKVLNLYYSMTGNTEKVAKKIEETVRGLGYEVHTVKAAGKDELYASLLAKYHGTGDINPGSPKRPQLNCVVYCTYGGGHTGINEAVPAIKYMGQLFDHLGYNILAEWYIVGEYATENLTEHNIHGRLGDIRGRPNESDLRKVTEKVKGILKAVPK